MSNRVGNRGSSDAPNAFGRGETAESGQWTLNGVEAAVAVVVGAGSEGSEVLSHRCIEETDVWSNR